jgi:uncharacterized membrane protein
LISAKFLKRYLIAGLLVWIPLWATAVVIAFVVEVLDKTVALLPDKYQPMNVIGINIPGIGIVISFVVLLVTGMVATNFLGERLVGLGEKIVKRIPLVGSIHQAVKQVMQTIFSTSNQSFRKVLLVEYPRKGLWSIAFQTAATSSSVAELSGGDKITIFIPTTPNPTSGFLMLIDKSEAKELDISIDDALKMIISLGVVQPGVELPPLKKG